MYTLISTLAALPLVVFSLRRLLFTVAAVLVGRSQRSSAGAHGMRPDPPAPHVGAHGMRAAPDLLVLVPCRNDGALLPGIVQTLLDNGYPHEHLRILLIDDGSTDDSPEIANALAAEHAPVQALHFASNRGKTVALGEAIRLQPWGELVAVYDADHRPEPGALNMLAAAFAAANVAAASGLTAGRNALASASSYYAAVERLVHQQITQVAKDHLNLAPAILGSHCAFRRAALEQVGGFAPDMLFAEDGDLTVRLAKAGWRTRYLEAAPCYDDLPGDLMAYWCQHVRWSRGFNDLTRAHAPRLSPKASATARPAGAAEQSRTPQGGRRPPVGATRRSPLLDLELFLFSTGYLDRLALLAAAGLLVSDPILNTRFRFPTALMIIALALPYAQVIAALWRTQKPLAWWLRLPYLLLMFPVDVLGALRSTLDSMLGRPRIWASTARSLNPRLPRP